MVPRHGAHSRWRATVPDPSLIDSLSDLGLTGLLIVVLIGGFREWWIYGPSHKRQIEQLTKDRDFWRSAALRGTSIAEKAVEQVASRSE